MTASLIFLFFEDCMVSVFYAIVCKKGKRNFAFLFYVPAASYLQFSSCSLSSHDGNVQEKSQVTNRPQFLAQQK